MLQVSAATLALPAPAAQSAEASLAPPTRTMLFRRECCWLDYKAFVRCYRDRAFLTFQSDEVAHNPWIFAAIGQLNEGWFFGAQARSLYLEYAYSEIDSGVPRRGPGRITVSQRLDLTIRPAQAAPNGTQAAPWILSHPADAILDRRADEEGRIAESMLIFPSIVHPTPMPNWLWTVAGEFIVPSGDG